jgi:hypothetical protein
MPALNNYASYYLNGTGAWSIPPNPGDVTTTANGLMLYADKVKLNGIESGAQVNPGVVNTSSAGLMSAADKTKLNGITAGAQPNPGEATSDALGLIKLSTTYHFSTLYVDVAIPLPGGG